MMMKPVLHEIEGNEINNQKKFKQKYYTLLLNGTRDLTASTEE